MSIWHEMSDEEARDLLGENPSRKKGTIWDIYPGDLPRYGQCRMCGHMCAPDDWSEEYPDLCKYCAEEDEDADDSEC